MNIAAVVAGAGWGTLDKHGKPKSCEVVGGKPMIQHTIDLISDPALALDPIVVVVNPQHGDRIRETLAAYDNLHFEVQPERKGPPDTVMRALPVLRDHGVDDFLAVYVDMPLWSVGTVKALLQAHRTHRPAITMVTVDYDRCRKQMKRYGIVLRTDTGGIAGTVEMDEATPEQIAEVRTVNPSLWVWHGLEWLESRIPNLRLHDKGDGFSKEHHFPDLVGVAVEEGLRVVEVPLDDPDEGMGVNTMEDYREVEGIFARRRNTV